MSALGHSEVRALLQQAAESAGLPIDSGKRALIMGPPLPSGATSEAEYVTFDLETPREPSEVRQLLNVHLPVGLRVEQAWAVMPGGCDENPSRLDEAEYDLTWRGAPPTGALLARLQQFLQASEVSLTRVREKKTQQLNARALLREIHLLGSRDGEVRLRVSVSIGPEGTLRPAEVVQALGYQAPEDAIRAHRVALRRTAWREPGRGDWRAAQRLQQD